MWQPVWEGNLGENGWLNHFAVHLKLSQHCELAIILLYKIKSLKKKRIQYSVPISIQDCVDYSLPLLTLLFSTSEHLYFLLSPSLPNPTLWIFVGVWATENTLGTDNCVDLSLSSSPPFSPPAHLYLLPPSPILHVTLWTSLVVPHSGKSFHH